ncbi:uncharacterized protein UDID_18547 [Ustilago sp. UG-2017a]|nr:uncharacterized protein UDID_18547 [Ustilago sp. UG-2017a]
MAPPNHSERIESLEDQVCSLLTALNARNTQEPFNDSASAQQGFRSKEPEAFTGERGHLEPFVRGRAPETWRWLGTISIDTKVMMTPRSGVSVDDDEVDGVGDKVGDDKAGGVGGGVNTSVQCAD